jgi:hypothetical protein
MLKTYSNPQFPALKGGVFLRSHKLYQVFMHELGHILGSSHNKKGLMTANFDYLEQKMY